MTMISGILPTAISVLKPHAMVESIGCLSGCVISICSCFYKKSKLRTARRKAFDGEKSKPGNAYCVVQAFNESKLVLQKVNGGVPNVQLKIDKITVDQTTGHIVTTYTTVEVVVPQPAAEVATFKLTKGMSKLWRKGTTPVEIAPGDVMEPVKTFLGESLVNDSPREEVQASQTPPCLLVVGLNSETMLLHGFRDGPCITIPWHGFYNSPALAKQVFDKGTIFVRCLKTGKEKECKIEEIVTHNKSPDKMNQMRGTGLDSLCIRITSDDWSVLGAASLCGSKRSNPFMAANGYQILCYSQDFQTRKIYRSEGRILPDISIANHGLIKHTCNTEAGCSGTPLWSVVNGRLMWSGMHIGNWGAADSNVGVSVSAYGHLRRLAGLVIKTPKASTEMLSSLQKMSDTIDPSSLQNLLDAYLGTIKEEVDEYDGSKLAPTCPAQLAGAILESAPHGVCALASVLTSSDSYRSHQSTLCTSDYESMAAGYDEENDVTVEEQLIIGGDKSLRRAHKDATDAAEYHQDREQRSDMEHNIFIGTHGDNIERFQASTGIRPTMPSGSKWADFSDESIRDLLLGSNITPDLFLRFKKQAEYLPTISEESHAGSEPPSTESLEPPPTPSPPPELPSTDPPGVLSVAPSAKPSPDAVSFRELKDQVSCQSLPSPDQRERDDFAKKQLGFDHANYSCSRTVIENEAELRALTERDYEQHCGPDPITLVRDVMLGKVPMSTVASHLETSVSYSDLRDHPLLQDYWKMVDTTADKKDVDPRPLITKDGKEAVSKDGDPMARVVAEISPSFKGGTTTQPQRLDQQIRASLERLEVEFRRELAETQDPKLIEALLHAPISWDSALPPTSNQAVKDSLVSQLKRLGKGGFKCYSRVAASIEEHWSRIISRYDTADITGDLDKLHSRIDDAFDALDLSKSSGWSSRVVPGTKEAWSAGSNRARIEEWIRARMLIHTVLGPNMIGRMSPYLLVKSGCKDPEELFIKMEVHKPKKQASLRWRLIWNPSLLDTLVLYTLHVRTNKKSLEAFEAGRMTHQVLGMGHHDEGIDRLGEIIDELYKTGKPVTTSDASGWDFSVRRDGFYLDAYRRMATTKSSSIQEKQLYDNLLLTQAAVLSAHVVAIGSELVEILHFGILSSGILSTGDINSFLRTTYAFCAGAVATMACSDDLVAAGEMDMQDLENLGIIAPEVEVVPQGMPIEFTSHKFVKQDGKWTAIYNNVDKLFNGLILKNLKLDGTLVYPGEETASGQRFALRHNTYASAFYQKLYDVFSWHLPEADPFAIATY